MTEDNRARFAELMFGMGETFNEPVSSVRAGAYFDALSDLPIESVEQAVRLAVKQSKFFPKPVELRECITGNQTDEAATEWALFQREVSRTGYTRTPELSAATMETVRVLFGSWRTACASLPSPDSDRAPELMNWRKQFIQVYGDTKRREALGELNAGPSLTGLISDIHAWEQKRTKEIA